jgi:hypothetical protein
VSAACRGGTGAQQLAGEASQSDVGAWPPSGGAAGVRHSVGARSRREVRRGPGKPAPYDFLTDDLLGRPLTVH